MIFISIDDNEQAHLRMIMDEIFGPGNFICSFAWEKRYGPPPDTKDIGYTHEGIHAYRKSEAFSRNLLASTADQLSRYKNPDGDPRGPWKTMDYTCRYTKDERPNLFYPIIHPKTKREIWPKPTRVWAFSRDEHLKNEEEKSIWWGKRGTASVPAKKNFLHDVQKGFMPVSLLKYESVGHTDEAAKELFDPYSLTSSSHQSPLVARQTLPLNWLRERQYHPRLLRRLSHNRPCGLGAQQGRRWQPQIHPGGM